MQVTRRFWTAAGLGGVLAAGAAVFARPLLLMGATAIGGWLLVQQTLFVARLARLDEALTVEQRVTPERIHRDGEVSVTLAASVAEASPLRVRVTARPPVATTDGGSSQRVELDGETAAETAFSLTAPIAGSLPFERPTVRVTDATGLFCERLRRGSTPAIQVLPRVSGNLHVGEGGETVTAAFGGRETDRGGMSVGGGIEPARLRRYVAGDAADRIDWKATARLDEAYVREYETEGVRTTALLVDHRASMAAGPDGGRKLDYAREVALAFLSSARSENEPLGLYATGDGGTTERHPPRSTPGRYDAIERALSGLEPTGGAGPAGDTAGSAATDRVGRGPAAARRARARLADDGSAFAATLAPFYAATRTYVERVEREPLYRTARSMRGDADTPPWTVVFTDETDPEEVRETARVARQDGGRVVLFLTPTVLFETGGLSDLERAYDRYREFEQFRRELARLDGVTAFELGPGDRLEAILGAHRARRERRGAQP